MEERQAMKYISIACMEGVPPIRHVWATLYHVGVAFFVRCGAGFPVCCIAGFLRVLEVGRLGSRRCGRLGSLRHTDVYSPSARYLLDLKCLDGVRGKPGPKPLAAQIGIIVLGILVASAGHCRPAGYRSGHN